MTRVRRVESEREMEQELDDFVTKGYKIQKRGEFSSKVKEKDYGAVPVHGFVFIFTLIGSALLLGVIQAGTGSAAWIVAILSNLLYASYSWFTAEEVLIKVVDGGA